MKTRIILSLLATFLLGCGKDYESPFAGGDNYISSFRLEKDGVTLNASISKGDIVLAAPETLELHGATATVTLSENATIKPDPSSIVDWGAEHTFTVSAYNGASNTYKYSVARRAATSSGDVFLLSQADVEALAALKLTRIDGSLTIGAATGEDSVSSLAPLAGLKAVTRTLSVNATFAGTDLSGLESLESVGSLQIVGTRKLLAASLPKLTNIPVDLNVEQSTVRALAFPELVETGKNLRIYYADSLRSISLPKLRNVVGNFTTEGRYGATTSEETLSLPMLETVGGTITLRYMPALKEVDLPLLKNISTLAANNAVSLAISSSLSLERISIPLLESCGAISLSDNNSTLKTLDLRSLQIMRGPLNMYGKFLETLELAKLQKVAGVLSCTDMNLLEKIIFPELSEVTGNLIVAGANIKEASYPKLETLTNLYLTGAALTKAEFPKLKTLSGDLSVQSPTLTTLNGLAALESVKNISVSGAKALSSLAGLRSLKSAVRIQFYNAESLTEIDLRGMEVGTLEISGTSWTNLSRIAGDEEFAGKLSFSTQGIATLPEIVGFRRVEQLSISPFELVTLDAGWLEKVTGEFSCSSSNNETLATINLPNLKSVGSLTFLATETLNVPGLETIGGGASLRLTAKAARVAFPKLRSIAGPLNIYNQTNTVDHPLASLSFPALETIDGTLTLQNSYAASRFVNFTNLDGFSKLRAVKGVTITRFANLVDFKGLKNAVRSFTRYEWNVTNNGYNPTYQEMMEL